MSPIGRRLLALGLGISLVVFMVLPAIIQRANRVPMMVWAENATRSAALLTQSDLLISPDLAENTRLAVVVCSAVENFAHRLTIRQSWAGDKLRPADTSVLFILGKASNETIQEDVVRESDQYGDIVQADFVDNYANLTVKSLFMLKWVVEERNKVEFLLKTDDDVYVNLRYLRDKVLPDKEQDLLVGDRICGAVPIRDPYSKWFTPGYMFKGGKYPNYLSGTGYLMSRTTAVKLLKATHRHPVFHLEDIYVTGILARAVGIKPDNDCAFTLAKRKLSPCIYATMATSHHLSADEMRAMADRLASDRPLDCRPRRHKCPKVKCKWF